LTFALDDFAPNYRAAVDKWPDAPTLGQHYRAVAEAYSGTGHALIETVKSFLECVCLTILGEFGKSLPSSTPSTTDMLVETLKVLGIANSQGASKFDKVISNYNRLADTLTECRNESGPVAHGKDGFLTALCSNQLRTYLLAVDSLLALVLAALEGTEPDIMHTREPYEVFQAYHERVDSKVFVQADVSDEAEIPTFVLTIGTLDADGTPSSFDLRVEPSRLLYALDRAAFRQVLDAPVGTIADDELPEEEEDEKAAPKTSVSPEEESDERRRALQMACQYTGGLGSVNEAFSRFITTLGLDPKSEVGVERYRLGASLLQTAEGYMHTDWHDRETLKSAMRVSLGRVLVGFGVTSADAREYSGQIASWLQIQIPKGDSLMTEICPNLYVGHQGDYEYQVKGQDGWAVIHACKEPYHRQLLGYTGRGAPEDDPDYFFAERGNRLYLNLVDAPNPAYIPKEIIDKAISFIHARLSEGVMVLVHCNQGESRGPGIGFLYMLRHTDALPKTSLDEALAAFRKVYSSFRPSGGISGFIAQHWEEYAGGENTNAR